MFPETHGCRTSKNQHLAMRLPWPAIKLSTSFGSNLPASRTALAILHFGTNASQTRRWNFGARQTIPFRCIKTCAKHSYCKWIPQWRFYTALYTIVTSTYRSSSPVSQVWTHVDLFCKCAPGGQVRHSLMVLPVQVAQDSWQERHFPGPTPSVAPPDSAKSR